MTFQFKLGFTGTRQEPTLEQKRSILRGIEGVDELHHGCCEGSDYFAHRAAFRVSAVWLHPPTNEKLMVPVVDLLLPRGESEIRLCKAKPYHARNRDIVDSSDYLMATPDGPRRPHSGTWYTIDYALGLGKPVAICLPDGGLDVASTWKGYV